MMSSRKNTALRVTAMMTFFWGIGYSTSTPAQEDYSPPTADQLPPPIDDGYVDYSDGFVPPPPPPVVDNFQGNEYPAPPEAPSNVTSALPVDEPDPQADSSQKQSTLFSGDSSPKKGASSNNEMTSKEKVPTKKFDPRIPRYQQMKPAWGVQIAGATKIGQGNPFSDLAGGSASIKGISLQVEYLPVALQEYGVFSIGPSLALYPASGSLTENFFSIWSFGGQVRYQARYWREQVLVPTVAYSFETWSYELSNGESGNFTAQGPSFGLWLLLNKIESKAAADFYSGYGVLRSYLVAEARILSGTDSFITLDGSSFFFGLRFEF